MLRKRHTGKGAFKMNLSNKQEGNVIIDILYTF